MTTYPPPLLTGPPFETMRIRRGTAFYVFCLASIVLSYYAYWWLSKLKAYYFGWILCAVMAIGMLLADHVRAPRLGRDVIPVALWFAYLLASALWSPSAGTTLYFFGADLINLVAFLVSYIWARSTSEWSLSGFFQVQVLMIVPLVALVLATLGDLAAVSLGAVRTGFATSCLTAIPFLIWRLRRHVTAGRIAILFFALAVLLSGSSRSALLITPVLLVGAFVFVGHGHVPKLRSIGLLFAVVSLLALLIAVIPGLRESAAHSLSRFSSGATRLSVGSSVVREVALPAEVRVDIERRLQLFIAFQSFLSHPLIGGGFQSTLAIIHERFGWDVSAHGLPSTLLGETGLVGTAIFVWMIARFFRRIDSADPDAVASRENGFAGTCKLTMLGILLLGLFHQVDQTPQLFVLLAWGYARPTPARQRP